MTNSDPRVSDGRTADKARAVSGITHHEADALATAAVAVAKAQARCGGEDAPIGDLMTFNRWLSGDGPRYAETPEELPFMFAPRLMELVERTGGNWENHDWESTWRARLAAEQRARGIDHGETQSEMTATRKDQHP